MKKTFVRFLLLAACWPVSAQILTANGDLAANGALFAQVPNGQPTAIDPALLNWCTSIACTPHAASPSVLCVGTPVNATALPGGGCSLSFAGTISGLNSALLAVPCGGIVNIANLPASTMGEGAVNLPIGPNCANNNWIWVTHDLSDPTFPAEGTRIDECYIGIPQTAMPSLPYPGADTTPNSCSGRHLPQLKSNLSSGNSAFSFAPTTSGAAGGHWRFIGLEITRDQSFDLSLSLVDLDYQPSVDCATTGTGNAALPVNATACMNDQPTFLIFDRSIIHGDAQRQSVIGIKTAGVRWLAVVDSDIYDMGVTYAGGAGDSHAFGGGSGHGYTNVGWHKFINDRTDASTMACLYCGAFVEPTSPATGFDGIPQNVWMSQMWFYKNPLRDTQMGQTQNQAITVEGQSYGPVPAQELDITPSAFGLAVNQQLQINTTVLFDSGAGFNRLGGSNSITASCGTITKYGEHQVGSGAWNMQNLVTYVYTAPASVPPGGTCTLTASYTTKNGQCTGGPCSGGSNTGLGNNLTLTKTAVITITAGTAPINITVAPNSPNLEIQPSYPGGAFGGVDANGNSRQFCYVLWAFANYTPNASGVTWSVQGVTGGNATVGTVSSTLTGLPVFVASGTNSTPGQVSTAAYCSGNTPGLYTITASATDASSGHSASASVQINVTASSPIWAYDLKPFTSKNIWELKCANKWQLDHSLGEVAWGANGAGGGQGGPFILLQPINQANQTNDGAGNNVGYGPEHINDGTVSYVHFRHSGQGLSIAGLNTALGVHRIQLSNVLVDDANYLNWLHGFQKVSQVAQITGTAGTTQLPWTSPSSPVVDNINAQHWTFVNSPITSTFSLANNILQFPLINFVFKNSIISSNGSSTFANNNGDTNDANGGNTEALAFQGSKWNPAIPLASCPAPASSKTILCHVSDQPGISWMQSVTGAAYAAYTPPDPAPPGTTFAIPYNFDRIAFLDSTAAATVFCANTTCPNPGSTQMWQPASTDAALFRNYAGGDYRVVSGGIYDAGGARDADDGLALGADVAGINASDAAVLQGTRTP